jgi:UDP-N-acetylmuramoyl-L-alanyl-D-glutamate--2,6-diaminopimelate ligase
LANAKTLFIFNCFWDKLAATMISLKTLFIHFPFPIFSDEFEDVAVTRVTSDSRQVEPGTLFVAMAGGSVDSHKFIPDAIARGAVAVVGEQLPVGSLTVPYIRVENARRSLAYLAGAYYDYPARKLTMIGVTGTDGKTTTCNLLYRILLAARVKVGMISTVNAVIGNEVLDTGFHVTTPDAPDVQRYLAKMVDAGLTHVVLETTSHGWAQYRVDACEFDIGVVTNITHEHLDYHGSYENYRAAKARLFTGLADTLPKGQGNICLAVLNKDDSSWSYLHEVTKVKQASYGLGPDADIHAENITYDPSGIHFTAVGKNLNIQVSSRLVGDFNVSNCLAAFSATVYGLAVSPEVAAQGIASLSGVPGRMERIDLGQNFTSIVDFAHTPNALRVALQTARRMTVGRVIAVFGSAGLRDREKRRMMAEVSADCADFTVLTAEDPRTESLEDILAEMAMGAVLRGGVDGKTFWRINDRGEAIRFAIRTAKPGDVVIACGKGHEQSMCFGNIEYPWDDRTAMRAALSVLLGIDGPQMPYLPTQD